jgi:hypothetical protein
MGWITDTWRAATDTASTWGREASTEWRDTVREITGPADADRWAAERAARAEADPTWLARDGERVVEVDADGYPGREADPGDGRPVVEAQDQADAAYRRWVQEGERGNPPASAALDREIDAALREFPDVPAWPGVITPEPSGRDARANYGRGGDPRTELESQQQHEVWGTQERPGRWQYEPPPPYREGPEGDDEYAAWERGRAEALGITAEEAHPEAEAS